MAYNTKYVLRYCSRFGDQLRIELQIDGYVGQAFIIVNEEDYVSDDQGRNVVVNIDGQFNPDRDMNAIVGAENPFTLQFRNDTGDKGGSVRATSATMSFYEDMLFNIDDLATSDETGIRCKFFVNDEIEWIGFVTPDFFNVEITSNPVINLTASDRLGVLKDVQYPLQDFYTMQRVSKLKILVDCLKLTGLELPINICCRMYCEEVDYSSYPTEGDFSQFEYTNYLQDAYVSAVRFVINEDNEETIDCYTIIQKLMMEGNCFITQYKGEWWVINKADLESGDSILQHYNFDTIVQGSIDRVSFGELLFNHIDTGGQRTLIPAGAKNTYLLDHGIDRIYPDNPTFKGSDSFNVDAWVKIPFTPGFTRTTDVPFEYYNDGAIKETYTDEIPRLKILHQDIQVLTNLLYEDFNYRIPSSVPDVNNFVLQSRKFSIPTLSKKKTSAEIKITAVGKPNSSLMIGIYLEFNDDPDNPSYAVFLPERVSAINDDFTGRYYFFFTHINGQNTNDFNKAYPLTFSNKYNNVNLANEEVFTINIDAANGVNQNFDLTKARMFVKIYNSAIYKNFKNNYNTQIEHLENSIKSVTIKFKSDDQTPKATIYQSILEANYTKPTERRDVLFGDFQNYGQNGYFYKYREDSLSIQYSSTGIRLEKWWTPQDTSRNPLLVHALRQLTNSYGRSHDELSIGFNIQNISPLSQYAVRCYSNSKVVVESDDKQLLNGNNREITVNIGRYLNDKRFVLVEGEFDYLRSHFTGKLAQVVNADADAREFIYSTFDNNTN